MIIVCEQMLMIPKALETHVEINLLWTTKHIKDDRVDAQICILAEDGQRN